MIRSYIHLQGTLSPLLGIGLCVSIQFGGLEYTKRFFASRNKEQGIGGPDGETLDAAQLFVAGVTAGLANGVVSGPVEHIRIRTSSAVPVQRFVIHEFQACKRSQTLTPCTVAHGMLSRRSMLPMALQAFTKVRPLH